jgi:hypothetical protein
MDSRGVNLANPTLFSRAHTVPARPPVAGFARMGDDNNGRVFQPVTAMMRLGLPVGWQPSPDPQPCQDCPSQPKTCPLHRYGDASPLCQGCLSCQDADPDDPCERLVRDSPLSQPLVYAPVARRPNATVPSMLCSPTLSAAYNSMSYRVNNIAGLDEGLLGYSLMTRNRQNVELGLIQQRDQGASRERLSALVNKYYPGKDKYYRELGSDVTQPRYLQNPDPLGPPIYDKTQYPWQGQQFGTVRPSIPDVPALAHTVPERVASGDVQWSGTLAGKYPVDALPSASTTASAVGGQPAPSGLVAPPTSQDGACHGVDCPVSIFDQARAMRYVDERELRRAQMFIATGRSTLPGAPSPYAPESQLIGRPSVVCHDRRFPRLVGVDTSETLPLPNAVADAPSLVPYPCRWDCQQPVDYRPLSVVTDGTMTRSVARLPLVPPPPRVHPMPGTLQMLQ